MLWTTYPIYLDGLALEDAYATLQGDPCGKIPFVVWLFENPKSPLSLPGKIDLYRHDCLHLLLKKGFDARGEAYILGFTMGNDPRTYRWHLMLFKAISFCLYPSPYRMNFQDFIEFDRGVKHGKNVSMRCLNQLDFSMLRSISLNDLRDQLGLGEFLIGVCQQEKEISHTHSKLID